MQPLFHCIALCYSGGKKILDTLKILHNLKYYHEIFFVFQKMQLH